MGALGTKGYGAQWAYALQNPAEVVAEVFTAYMKGKAVPRSLAATFVAYGGPMNSTVEAGLKVSLGDAWRAQGFTVNNLLAFIQDPNNP